MTNPKSEIPIPKSVDILSYKEISDKWNRSDMTGESARLLTIKQVEAFAEIIEDDEKWEQLLSSFNSGRDTDAWLAADWPAGFDELLLCVPLCKLVDFECSKCTVGKRQENNSCAHDDSLFGYIAEILKREEREELKKHVENIKQLLSDEKYKWNMKLHVIDL